MEGDSSGSAPARPPAPPRRGRAWVTAILVVGAAALVAVLLLSRASEDTSAGGVAIVRAQQAAAAGVARIERGLVAQGGSVTVRWSAAPAPAGGGHIVTARFEAEPSGAVGNALFGVVGAEVSAQDALARRILGDGTG